VTAGGAAGGRLLVYGAYGYTGELVARAAVAGGLEVVLGGRAEAPLAALAGALGLPHRAFPLDRPEALRAGLDGVAAVLHCAGPFSRTAAPMAAACLAAGAHYLDVTGEIPVFEALAALDGTARAAGVTVLPGTGFDVVPSDCLAAHLAARLPGARRLTLAFQAVGRPSRGTTLTALEGLHLGGMVRRGGRLTRVAAAWRTRTLDLGEGPVACMTVPWGDVFTAFVSTGIPDIEVYMAAPATLRLAARAAQALAPLVGSGPVQRLLARRVRNTVTGPDAAQRARGRSLLWGEVEHADGRRAAARLRVLEGYAFTARSAVACAARVLAGGVAPGFQTPATAFGPDFVLGIEGSVRTDLDTR
jgi:short subunit dehydrogenase-like uncharacterized protein